jgi:hypothetical protein
MAAGLEEAAEEMALAAKELAWVNEALEAALEELRWPEGCQWYA